MEFSRRVIAELSLITSTSAVLSARLGSSWRFGLAYRVDLEGFNRLYPFNSNLNKLVYSADLQSIRC
jgi:hypothetical protein